MRDLILGGIITFLAAAPSSSNFILRNYEIGSGGVSNATSGNYKLNGVSGTQTGDTQSSATYTIDNGLSNSQTANVPLTPTLTNPNQYYNRLRIQLNPGQDPSDTKYLIAISSDNFVTTNYVQADNTIGPSNAITNYQTYTAWGGASGTTILNLSKSTAYQVKVKAMQGNHTNTGYSPTASASTVAPSLIVILSITSSNTPPFPLNFPSLTPGTVASASDDIEFVLTSNALNGGNVYIKSNNAGLSSTLASNTISSTTADLASALSGYGAQVTSVSQLNGGPFTSESPYNGTSDNVGGLTGTYMPILKTTGRVTAGQAVISLKAKSTATTPSSSDYSDQITMLAAMLY